MSRISEASLIMFLLLGLPDDSRASEGKSASELNKGLASVRVIRVDSGGPRIEYLPSKVVFVDKTGRPSGEIGAVSLGVDEALISGRVSIAADPRDVADLEKRAKAEYGESAVVSGVKAREFGIWLYRDGTEIWRRDLAGGQTEGFPIQATLGSRPRGQSIEVDAVALLSWGETLPSMQARATVDWKSVEAGLRQRLDAEGALTNRAVDHAVATAMAQGKVRIEAIDRGSSLPEETLGRAREMIVAHISRILLEKPYVIPASRGSASRDDTDRQEVTPPPSKEKAPDSGSSFSVAYKVKRDLEINALTETIDLGTASYVERSMVVRNRLTIKF